MTEPLPSLGALRPELPASLCRIVERLLEKEPGRRFADPRALVRAVEQAEAEGGRPRHEAALAWSTEPGTPWDERLAVVAGTAADVKEAARMLASALGREEETRVRSRRRWVATAFAALVAAVVGFVVGRRGRATRVADGLRGRR
jgi:hypothetical protein